MRPLARSSDLVISHADADTLVYDSVTHRLHTLNATSSAIWRHSTGFHSIAAIAAAVSQELDSSISEETVEWALRDLATAGLVTGQDVYAETSTRQSRRALIAKAGLGGVVLPAVVSVTMSSAAAAASGLACEEPTVTAVECMNDPSLQGRCCQMPFPFENEIGYCGDTCNPFP